MPKSRSDIVIAWDKLAAAFRANPPAGVAVEPVLQEFETLLAEIHSLGVLQDVQTAAVQQTSKDIEARVKRGILLAARLRSAAKAFYGDRTEKIIEFGMRPFRKPVRAPKVIFVKEEPQTAAQEDTTGPAKPTT
jgi:hypothetical protein